MRADLQEATVALQAMRAERDSFQEQV